nr:GntR family transcriptional regulator [Bacillota bacterium]
MIIDPSQAQKVSIETKSEQVYRFLRESIILGDFAPGERLVLAKLAEKYGVSEIPIREAC